MSIRLVPRVTATVIGPDTPLPYAYTAGESIQAKAAVCKGESDGRIYEASASSWARMPAFGVSQEAKSAGQTINILQFGIATGVLRAEDFGYDDKVFVSETQGKLTKTPPEGIGRIVQSMGRALSASDIILQVDETVIELQEV